MIVFYSLDGITCKDGCLGGGGSYVLITLFLSGNFVFGFESVQPMSKSNCYN